MTENAPRGPGGTPGGFGAFLLGVVMAAGGGYLITNQVMVTTSFWRIWGMPAFGLTLVPVMFGIGLLFFNGKSILGWILTLAGAGMILFGILTHLDIYFRPTSLFNTIVMLVLLCGGLGLIAKSLRPSKAPEPPTA